MINLYQNTITNFITNTYDIDNYVVSDNEHLFEFYNKVTNTKKYISLSDLSEYKGRYHEYNISLTGTSFTLDEGQGTITIYQRKDTGTTINYNPPIDFNLYNTLITGVEYQVLPAGVNEDNISDDIGGINIPTYTCDDNSKYIVYGREEDEYYVSYYGTVSERPTTGEEILNNPNLYTSINNSYSFYTGTIYKYQLIAIPYTKSLVSIIDSSNLNVDLINDYIIDNNITNIAGVDYIVYILETNIPYTRNSKHNITLDNI